MTDELQEQGKTLPGTGVHPGLWIGLLLPPIVWALQMQINYWAVRGACVRGSNVRLYLVTASALFLVIASGLSALLSVRRSSETVRVEWGAQVSSSRFMLALAMLGCVVFFLAVLAQGIAAVVFHPCQL